MSDPRVLVCTPVFGHPEEGEVSTAYMIALNAFAPPVGEANPPIKFVQHRMFSDCDLVRARSRAARIALDGCYTHLLFWDSDVGGDCMRVFLGMLAQEVDFIAATYPRKRLPLRASHQPPYVPMGFTLLSQRCLETMWDRYYDELQFDDVLGNKPFRSVAMFQLLLVEVQEPRPHRVMLGEDYSFCERWLRLGETISVYEGEGTPLTHVGRFSYSSRYAGVGESPGSSA